MQEYLDCEKFNLAIRVEPKNQKHAREALEPKRHF